MNTTVPWIQRCLSKPIDIDGVMVEEGTLVQLDLYSLHNHQDVWENPNVRDKFIEKVGKVTFYIQKKGQDMILD